ncbi:MAG: dehypoxanthine futalosine cyclase [Euryarchaeota archaeon]|nr:dehypoxanthine futalosine cyclase [Euryarchaeota archaeon]|tara:strand:- start:22255 stop:23439 length:1185 start_codon:yes stop_codon:yes gene_type:complete
MNWTRILEFQSRWTRENSADFRLSEEDALELYAHAPLHELMSAAHLRRNAFHGPKQVTYLIDRNINYTNVCTINCQFCSFYRPPGHDETYTQSIDQISQRISELEAIGGVRILMQGGVNPELPFSWYEDLLRELRSRHPSIDIDCFSPIEIEGIAEVTGIDTSEVLTRLKAAGMHGLPGGGAEMLVEDVRNNVSPKKGSPKNWLRVMREAQDLQLTTSATNVIGFGETLEQRIEHMRHIRDLQERSLNRGDKGFTSFIAWPVQLEVNTFGKRNKGQNKITLGAGSTEYLRHVAVSRMFLDNIDNIQSSWPTMGIKTAQMALFGGANDVGSTMMEENVVSASGTTKFQATEMELQNVIVRAGFMPQRRDSDYVLLDTPRLASNLEDLKSSPPAQF